MGFYFNLDGETDVSQPGAIPQGRGQSVGITDVGKSGVASTLDLASQAPAAAQYAAEKMNAPNAGLVAEGVGDLVRGGAKAVRESYSPAAKDAEEHPLDHPFGFLAMKGAELTPQIAAFAAFPEGLATQMAVGAGAQILGNITDTINSTADKTDEELKKERPLYAHLREQGDSEWQAKAKLHDAMLDGWRMVEAGTAGAIGGGLLGKVVKGAVPEGAGVLKGAGVGAAEASPGMAVMGAQADLGQQQGDINSGATNEIDAGRVAQAAGAGALTGLGVGGVLGGVAGLASRRAAKAAVEPAPQPAKGVEVVPTGAPNAAETAVFAAPDPGATPAQPPAAPAPAPVAPGSKGRAAKVRKAKVEVVDAGAPNEAETAAVAKPSVDPTEELIAKAKQINDEAQAQAAATPPAQEPTPAPELTPPVTPDPTRDLQAKADALPKAEPIPTPEIPTAEAAAPVAPPEAPAPPPVEAVPAPPPVTLAPQEAVLAAPREGAKGAVFKSTANADRVAEARAADDALPPGDAKQERGKVATDTTPAALKGDEPRFIRRAQAFVKANPDGDTPYHQALALAEQRKAMGKGQSKEKTALTAQIRELQKQEFTDRQAGQAPDIELDKGGRPEKPKPVQNERGKAIADAMKAKKAEREALKKGELDRQAEIEALAKQQAEDAKVEATGKDLAAKGSGSTGGDQGLKELGGTEHVFRGVSEEEAAAVERGTDKAERADAGTEEDKGLVEGEHVAGTLDDEHEASITNEPPVPAREREKPTLKEGEGYQVFGSKAPPKVEKKGERRKFTPPPKIAAQIAKVALKAREAIDAEVKTAEEIHAATPPAPPPAPKPEPVPAPKVVKDEAGNKPNRIYHPTDKGRFADPVETTTVSGLLGRFQHDKLNTLIARRVKELGGDTPVHIVTHQDMAILNQSRALGFYDNIQHHIVLRADELLRPESHTVLHEAIHAVANRAMRSGTTEELRKQVNALRNEVIAKIGRDEALKHYGLNTNNLEEFLAEGLSNPEFQRVLARTELSSVTIARLGLGGTRIKTAWDWMVRMVRQSLALPEGTHTALDGLLKVADHLTKEQMRLDAAKDLVTEPGKAVSSLIDTPLASATAWAKERLEDTKSTSKLRQWSAKIISNDQFRQMREKLFGEADKANPMRRLTDTIEKMGTSMREYRVPGDKLQRQMIQLARKYEGDKGWDAFVKVAHDSTMGNVHPDRPLDSPSHNHLGKDSMAGVQGKAIHADVSAQYRALPAELKELFQTSRDFFEATHNDMARKLLRNVLEQSDLPPGVDPVKEAERIFTTGLSKDELAGKGHFSEKTAAALDEARELKKVEGAYFPLMRRGDFVVTSEHKVALPAGAKQVDPNTFEFKTRDEAKAFLRTHRMLRAKNTIQWYDALGNAVKTKDDGITTAGPAVPGYRVKLQRQHVEFHETQRSANEARAEMLAQSDKFENTADVRLRADNPGIDYELSSPQVKRLLKSIDQRTGDAQRKGELKAALLEASLKMTGGTRVQTRQVKRRNVLGASDDLIKNTSDYSQSTSAYRAKLDHTKEANDALDAMKVVTDKGKYSSGPDTLLRDETVREMENRLHGTNAPESTGPVTPFMRAVMTTSFLKRMASPAHLLLHMTHPTMISAPVIGARHGVPRAYGALMRAYKDMGARGALGQGMTDFMRFAKDGNAEPTNWVDHFKKNLAGVADAKQLGEMLDVLAQTGHIHPDAGMEVHQNAPSQNGFMQGLNRVDAVFRQLTQATESINRVAEAISAYRLEAAKSGHEAAIQYAKDTLANTQGLYSATNAPPLFRNGALRPFLQFKQFPQMIYHLLGSNLYKAFKGDTPEVRREAAKAFLGVVTTHAAMAGALGLPLEILKIPVMLANALGVSHTSWQDLEDDAQAGLANQIGGQGAEIFMHGLSRALGPLSVDVHHRLGLGSLMFFGEPKPGKDGTPNAQAVNDYLTNFLFGAPGSMLLDTVGGVQDLTKGDYQSGIEKLLPAKAFTDVAKAARLTMSGKPSKQGGGMAPLGLGGAIAQGLGFQPAAVANYGAARNMAYHEQGAAQDAHSKLIATWVGASPAAKADAQRAALAGGVKMQELTRAQSEASRAKAAEQSGKSQLGYKVTPKNREMLDRAARTFNVGN